MKSIFTTLLLLVCLLPIQSIGQSTVFDKIAADPDLQEFEEAIIRGGLVNTFKTLSPLTVFAVNNAGFPTIPASYNQSQVADIVLTHCVNGMYRSADFTNGFSVSTINTRNLTVKIQAGDILINNQKLLSKDKFASNGVVHVIGSYIPKSQTTVTTVMSIIENSPKHTLLANVIRNARLTDLYEDPGTLTLFAPTNEAFFALSQNRLDQLLGTNVNYIKNYIYYHTINEIIEKADFKNNGILNTLNDQEITVTVNINGTYVNNIKVGFAGLKASNGIVYVINKVLIPEPLPDLTIADWIDASEDHETLSDLVALSGMRSTLDAAGAMTFFAPTDEAFDEVGSNFLNELMNDPDGELREVIRNHLVSGKHYLDDLIDDEEKTSVNGYELIFDRESVRYFVNDAEILISDIEVDNGLVFVIDAILAENVINFTVADILDLNGSLSSFNDQVVASGMDSLLRTQGPFTVFAPTNAAMIALPAHVREALDSGLFDEIFNFVRNHVVLGAFASPLLTDSLSLTAFSGLPLKVTVTNDNRIFINDSQITLRNLEADNGFVHIIDVALYPEFIPTTIYEYISTNDDHSVLTNAVDKASLKFLYDGQGPLTLFAPTNGAFAVLSDGIVDDLFSGSVSDLVDLLLDHTLNGRFTLADLLGVNSVQNANQNELTIIKNGSDIFINDAKLIISDIELDNGIVHVIDAVIINASGKNTILDIVRESVNHNNLLDAIILAGKTAQYEFQTNLTLFAPTDNAINNLPAGVWSGLLVDPQGGLSDFLAFHTLLDSLTTSDMTDDMVITMANGVEAYIEIVGSQFFINDVRIITRDVIADNGVVHVIDIVLEEKEKRNTVYDVIADDDRYSILKDALISTGLDQTLINETSITYFAPTNIAFNALSQSELLSLLSDDTALRDLLEFHLFEHNLSMSSMSNGISLTMANGEATLITDPGDGFYINNARISEFDNFADNGIVHTINTLIEPIIESVTVYDIIQSEEELSIFRDAVDMSGRASDLDQADLVTVFAPSDDAFEALPMEVLQELLDDPTGLLRDLVDMHSFNGNLLTSFMTNGTSITMKNGTSVDITVNSEGIFVNDAKLIFIDLIADNGVVHVLDAVLLEEGMMEKYTIFDLVKERSELNILENSILRAGLDDELNDGNDLTLFAPTDDAFSLLPQSVLDAILSGPVDDLEIILLNHLHDGLIRFIDFNDGANFSMAGGLDATMTLGSDGYYINNALISVIELYADNGIVHIIDAVIQEVEVRNSVYDIISNSNSHFILKETIDDSGLADDLIKGTGLTFFAPTDAAFNASLDPAELMALLNDPTGDLKELLEDHLIYQTLLEVDLVDGYRFTTEGELDVNVIDKTDGLYLNDAKLITTDIQADNGVVHVIDAVLMPLISSNDELDEKVFSLYPNPVSDVLYVKDLSSGIELTGKNVKIYSADGQLIDVIRSENLRNGLDVKNLEPGMYILSISESPYLFVKL